MIATTAGQFSRAIPMGSKTTVLARPTFVIRDVLSLRPNVPSVPAALRSASNMEPITMTLPAERTKSFSLFQV
ncbi:MAG: hypothetical protein BWY83_02809 [bacterium ADurb.Bin478]|nr:MAG: hypothetical protein BWY83_02809 [bacterium ADurb.Bin478]